MRYIIVKNLFFVYNRILEFYYKFRNRGNSKLLIYTDSRGFDVLNLKNRNPKYNYISLLQRHFWVEYRVCPHKYTTIIDFIDYMDQMVVDRYDYIVLHCGIVDFSPRPISNFQILANTKRSSKKFSNCFAKNSNHYCELKSVLYNGENTINLYSKEYLSNEILPVLKSFGDRLIYISSNYFVANWEGNYLKGRPKNIDEVAFEYNNLLLTNLNNSISIYDWDERLIKLYTIDNIHFSKEGFKEIFNRILKKISKDE